MPQDRRATTDSARPWPRAGRARLGLPLLAAAVLAVSCSSSGGSSTGGSAGSETPFVIGNITSATGTYASSIGGAAPLVDAWVQWTNAHGGINGHPVKIIAKDDGGIPSKGIAAAKALMSAKVTAIVGPVSNTVASWHKIVTAAGIPVIGGQTNGAGLYQTEPLLFPTGATDPAGVVSLAASQGSKKFGVMYCTEAPACASQTEVLTKATAKYSAALNGISIAYTGTVASSAPNYTAQCLAAKQAGVDALYVANSASVTVRILKDCASQGFKPTVVGYGPSADDSWLTEPALDGALVEEQNFPWFGTETEVEKTLQAAIAQYAPDLSKSHTFNANISQTWASLEVYKAIVEQGKLTPSSTAENLVDAIHALPKGWKVDGVTPPLTFGAAGSPNPAISCYYTAKVENGAWVEPTPGKYDCLPTG
ncbi:branched-chain amino acid transport system substrate-binding protein [Parafrankia irregularis]|uniref:Branched-chain amino acid transport system substrate-binding protein n=1 Tax=Parafrankia irregularis TaxID=795642 RepID=A0A0S4QKZ4_9ACTN|nr:MULTISPECIES: ABC transporter substrate-binding protein [Parafrankia]MBE3201346.1 ABC transporter substrate-binding protein [Parafrankia sp. CH37]CUU56199.1 branched-chain amino acid transport system substrate-binding protein [Parafrankia irregularis]